VDLSNALWPEDGPVKGVEDHLLHVSEEQGCLNKERHLLVAFSKLGGCRGSLKLPNLVGQQLPHSLQHQVDLEVGGWCWDSTEMPNRYCGQEICLACLLNTVGYQEVYGEREEECSFEVTIFIDCMFVFVTRQSLLQVLDIYSSLNPGEKL
jgi:hypothetical protein